MKEFNTSRPYIPKQHYTIERKKLIEKGINLVFCPTGIQYPKTVKEHTETIDNIKITTYLIEYDETKW